MFTYWPEIKKLEDGLEEGDLKHLKEFIDLLKENKQLNRHMYHVLCECTNNRKDCLIRWELLHTFAKDKGGI